MDAFTLTILIIVIIVALALAGGLLVFNGKDNKDNKKILAGWIVLSVLFTGLTALLLFFVIMLRSATLTTLLFLSPLIILFGIIIGLCLGISRLTEGFSKKENGKRDPKKIVVGFVCLGIVLTIIATIIVLLVLFATGIIPIRFM